MNEYDFTLKYKLTNTATASDPSKFLDALFEAGCDDAIIGVGTAGRISLNFIREAECAAKAVTTALADVRRAIPEAVIIEASPDLVGLTDVGEILGFSRQNMRKVMIREDVRFPFPVYDEGKLKLWHLVDILRYLATTGLYNVDASLLDMAETNRFVNMFLGYQKCGSEPVLEKELKAQQVA